MKLNICHCIFVLDEPENDNKRKSNIPEFKVVVDKNGKFPKTDIVEVCNLKEQVRNTLQEVIGDREAHTEQVYTLSEEKYDSVSVIYLTVTHKSKIRLKKDYQLMSFDIIEQKEIVWGEQAFYYNTVAKKIGNHLEYVHEINCDDVLLEKSLLSSLIAYKYLKNRIDYTDTMFHLLPTLFTLEQVRILYEKIKCVTVDKSNFRKKIMGYCEETNEVMNTKGYRPAKYYKFKVREDDVWL